MDTLPSPPEVLPAGVRRHRFQHNRDVRGALFEIYRESWGLGVNPVQWNAVKSEAGVLRGVHLHARHHDFLVVLWGMTLVGLKDLRPGSPTEGLAVVLELRSDTPEGLVIPPGVAHGFYFPDPALHVYAVTHYWDPLDEMGCHWADRELGIPWPEIRPSLSERDTKPTTLAELRQEFLGRWQG